MALIAKARRYFLAAIFAGVACSSACSPDDDAEAVEPEVPAELVEPDVRVMTYNIHLGDPPDAGDARDLPGIASVINEFKPDLVALQEVDVYTERSGADVHQARELGRLTGMKPFYVKAMDVFGGGAYGIAILSRFDILDSASYSLPPDPQVGGEMRKLAVVKVALPNGREIVFAGTHLDHRSEENRLHQGNIVLNTLDRYDLPVILAGDFNAPPQTLTVEQFDEFYKRTCRLSCPATFPTRSPSSAIDFIMYRKGNNMSVVSHKTVVEADASDHLPVVAGLKFN